MKEPLRKTDVMFTPAGNKVVSTYMVNAAVLWIKSFTPGITNKYKCQSCDQCTGILFSWQATDLCFDCLIDRAFGEAIKV